MSNLFPLIWTSRVTFRLDMLPFFNVLFAAVFAMDIRLLLFIIKFKEEEEKEQEEQEEQEQEQEQARRRRRGRGSSGPIHIKSCFLRTIHSNPFNLDGD